jgi:uncharacterized membrane protein (GlpM family)
MVNDINYVIYSIFGAIVLPLQYYFSKNKQYKLCALIPTIPILGLTGLFILIFYSGNVNKYIKNHIAFLMSTISLYISLIFIYYLTNNIYVSLVLAILIWFCIVYNVLNFKF